MKYKDKIINNQFNIIKNQIDSMTAYGVDGFSIMPVPDEAIGNEDTEADKENSREWKLSFLLFWI